MRGLEYIFALQLALSSQSLLSTTVDAFGTTVQVCQNKDCCQRFEGQTDLVQTLHDLLPPSAEVLVEASGCLSQCGKGPNINVVQSSSGDAEGLLVHGIRDATTAAAELELSCSLTLHPTLLAATKVIEKAAKAKTPEEKLKFLNSVINKLKGTEELAVSSAVVHAHSARAEVHLKLQDYESAKDDARFALETSMANTGIPLPPKTYRVLVDAEEATENFQAALEVLRQWTDRNPQFATKAAKEAQRVRSKMIP